MKNLNYFKAMLLLAAACLALHVKYPKGFAKAPAPTIQFHKIERLPFEASPRITLADAG